MVFKFSKEDLINPNLELPSISVLAPIFQNRQFKIEILPYKNNETRDFKAICALCNYSKISKWPFNTTNLASHFNLKHKSFLTINNNNNTNNNSDNNNNNNNLDSDSNIEDSSSINTLNNYFSNNSNTSLKVIKKRPSFVFFDKDSYKSFLLSFIVNNNLPFSIIDSPSFLNLLKYIKDDLPTISRITIRTELDNIYIKEYNKVLNIINNNNSKFSITLDEWRSSSNLDFLAITLHFINNNFKLENYLIGFEDLNKLDSYNNNSLLPILENVLKDYKLENKLLGVTKDNAATLNSLINNLNIKLQLINNNNNNIIDNKCAAHILNVVTNTFLDFTFFNINTTKKFQEKIDSLVLTNTNRNIKFDELIEDSKNLPLIVRTYINKIKNNSYLKNNFKRLAIEKAKANNNNNKIESLIKDNSTRWLSTYNMIDTFIYFKNEINTLYKKTTTSRNINSYLEHEIDINQWRYLEQIKYILENFKKPTIKLQTINYSNNYLTIVYITKLWFSLIKLKDTNFNNPLITKGLQEAINKLLEYYPINDTNINKLKDLYLITILNPHFKLDIFRKLDFKPEIINNIRLYFIEVYNKYKENNNISLTKNNNSTSTNLDLSINLESDTDSDNDLYITNSSFNSNTNIDNEIEIYLQENRIHKEIKIEDYYNSNKTRFPIIYKIARDYLSILSTSNASESTFSKVGDIVTKKRNRLLLSTIKKLIILKSWNIIEDEETEINDNKLLKNKNKRTRNKGKEKAINPPINNPSQNNPSSSNIDLVGLEEKSTTSITSYSSNSSEESSNFSN